MDIASIIGIVAGIVVLIASMMLGGSLRIYLDTASFMMVTGGTFAAVLLNFPFKDVLGAFRSAYHVFSTPKMDPNIVVANMVDLSNLSRRKGIVELSRIKTDSAFLRKAAMLISDGAPEEQIRRTLQIEIETLKLRHFVVQDVFKKLATYAPAFGMLGTIIGLVRMLTQLNDPQTLGPAMALALLTTMYGSILSTVLFLPIAGKLASRTMFEVINLEIIFEGAVSILENNNPMMVYEKLSSFIPRRMRSPMKRKYAAGDAEE
jgi:chemotaxis protein MotA